MTLSCETPPYPRLVIDSGDYTARTEVTVRGVGLREWDAVRVTGVTSSPAGRIVSA